MEKVNLGRKLFNDPRLSKSGKIACVSWEIVGRVVREDPEYRASITALFGTVENPRGSVTAAIAEFERSLVTVDSPFDL